MDDVEGSLVYRKGKFTLFLYGKMKKIKKIMKRHKDVIVAMKKLGKNTVKLDLYFPSTKRKEEFISDMKAEVQNFHFVNLDLSPKHNF